MSFMKTACTDNKSVMRLLVCCAPPVPRLCPVMQTSCLTWSRLLWPARVGVIVLSVQIDTVREKLPLQINHLPMASISSQHPFHAN